VDFKAEMADSARTPQGTGLDDPTLLGSRPSRPGDLVRAALNTPEPAPGAQAKARPSLDEAARQNGPKRDWQEIYHKRYAPEMIGRLIESGRLEEAKAFEEWSESAKGKRFGADWMQAYSLQMTGDTTGALKSMQKLYNQQLPDGQYALVAPEGNDGGFKVTLYDEKTNKPLHSRSGSGEELVTLGLGMMSPASVYKMLAEQKSNATAKAETQAWEREKLGLQHQNAMALEREKAASKGPDVATQSVKMNPHLAKQLVAAGADPKLVQSLSNKTVSVAFDKRTGTPTALYGEKENDPTWVAAAQLGMRQAEFEASRAEKAKTAGLTAVLDGKKRVTHYKDKDGKTFVIDGTRVIPAEIEKRGPLIDLGVK
jgi:hypothetical protein